MRIKHIVLQIDQEYVAEEREEVLTADFSDGKEYHLLIQQNDITSSSTSHA